MLILPIYLYSIASVILLDDLNAIESIYQSKREKRKGRKKKQKQDTNHVSNFRYY